jgi:thiamine biosynthesis lipoprotein
VFDVTTGSGDLVRLELGRWLLTSGAVDLGGIGKGFAVDKILRLWEDYELASGAVNFGQSSLGFLGDPPNGCWRVGVRDPNGAEGDFLGQLRVFRGCLSTSARPNTPEGRARTVHPAGGCCRSRWCSVTVCGPSATSCEAWSTALLAGGEPLLVHLAAAGLHAVVV